jgi:hypothetical protein
VGKGKGAGGREEHDQVSGWGGGDRTEALRTSRKSRNRQPLGGRR